MMYDCYLSQLEMSFVLAKTMFVSLTTICLMFLQRKVPGTFGVHQLSEWMGELINGDSPVSVSKHWFQNNWFNICSSVLKYIPN